MSSISYANVVATGSTTPTSQNDSTEINVESISQALEATTNSDEKALPSPTPSPKAETAKKVIQLAPAPVPEISAWGSAPTSRSNSNVDAKFWPSPLDAPQQNGSLNKKISVSKSSKEKWVPFKASVVLAQPNANKKHNGQKRHSQKNTNVNSNGSNNSNQKSGDAKKRKNKTDKRPQQSKDHQSQPQQQQKEESTPSTSTSTKSAPSETVNNEQQQEQQPQEQQPQQQGEQQEQPASSESKHEQNGLHEQKPNGQYQQRQFHKHNNQQHPQQFNQFQQPFYPQNQPFQRPNRTFNNNSRRYNKFNQVNGYVRNSHQHPSQHYQRRSFNETPYAFKPTDPLFSLIKQVEYYFSVANLVKDIYLRKQMNEEGWLPLHIIANFHRMSSLSAGDINLIRRSIDELNGTVLEIGEFDNDVLKIRAKENWKTWVLPTNQRDAPGLEEDKLVKLVIRQEPPSEETTEATSTETETKTETPVQAEETTEAVEEAKEETN